MEVFHLNNARTCDDMDFANMGKTVSSNPYMEFGWDDTCIGHKAY